jgi:tRNA nucleotidyltransferase (CCA-adding enzyme)
MTADEYLGGILTREAVDRSLNSPVRGVAQTLAPVIQKWSAGYLISVTPSGSFAKGTANKSGTDIDLFISLASNTPSALKEIYDTLFNALTAAGYQPKPQNVSISVRVGGYDVDLVPAKRQDAYSSDHSLYRHKADTWTKTT